jgi:hypothetical protein
MAPFRIFSHNLIRFIRKQNIPEDAAWKALQFTYDPLPYNSMFCFQIGQFFEPPYFGRAKIDTTTSLSFFLNFFKTITIRFAV